MKLPRLSLTSRLVAAGSAILFLSYWSIFVLTTDDGAAGAASASLNNTASAIVLGWLVHIVLDRHVWPARMATRLAAQVPLSVLFALAWYLAILVVRELRGDWFSQGFAITPFVPIAFAWQMFQGVTFYALAALASLSIHLAGRLYAAEREAGRGAATPEPVSPPAVLMRTGEGNESVAIDSILSISGAGDYSEVTLPGRTICSTTTLAEFESRLPQGDFLRAHRSHIVRLAAIERSEPAGNGRTTLHLVDGRSIVTSRAGTALLREAAL